MRTITDKIDHTARVTEEYRSVTPPAPISIKVGLTGKCNYRCGFCTNSSLPKEQHQHMPLDLFKVVARKAKDAGIKEIAPFYFGESFTVTYLPEAIAFCKEIGFEYIFLTTNGSVATPEKVKACMEAGLNSLKFSFNYADEAQFGQIARVNVKYWHKAIENLKAAHAVREAGNYDCGLFASYIKFTGEQGKKMDAVLDTVRPYLDEVYALPLFSQTGAIENKMWEFSGGNQGRADNPVNPVPCWALFKEGHVNADGTLNMCCFGLPNFTVGDLKTQTFMEAWHEPFFQDLRRKHLEKDINGSICDKCIIS